MSTDAIMGSTAPLRVEIHALRGHRGQIDVAGATRKLMEGSEIRQSHREGDTRVQDPYCIGCQPQVTGAALDLVRSVAATLEVEANAVTDNPLVIAQSGEILSGGNFHAEPVAFAADILALALSEIGAISQRRMALMVDPTLSFDLPPFLTPEPGLNSGLMIAEVTTAHEAWRLRRMTANLSVILGVEAICAAQGIEARAPLKTSPLLQSVLGALRARVAPLAEDLAAAADLTLSGALSDAAALRVAS